MKRQLGFNLLIITLLSISSLSCSTTEDTDTLFQSFSGENSSAASFIIDFSDSACIYSISLIVRLNKDSVPESIRTDISITSPSGHKGTETVYLPSDYGSLKRYIKSHPDDRRIQIASTPDYYDICWVYRDNIIPTEYGPWKIGLFLPDMKAKAQGAGITIRRKPVDTEQTE